MTIYEKEQERYQALLGKVSQTYNIISGVRLLLMIVAGIGAFQYYKDGLVVFIWITIICVIAFFFLVSKHAQVARQKKFYKQLVLLNTHEIAAQQGDYSNFADGAKYIDPEHPFTFDLDIFGRFSLFQYLNRTANAIGSDKLAQHFLHNADKAEILETQEAIRDLAPRLEWRQHFLATGQLHSDPESAYRKLLEWAETPVHRTSLLLRICYYGLTLGTIALGLVCVIQPAPELWNAFSGLAFFNLLVVGAHSKKIKIELEQLNAMYKIVAQYGFLIQCIEKETFTAKKLVQLKERLGLGTDTASKSIFRLSKLIHQLESVQNLFGALLFNSLFVYHLHVLLALEKWKIRHAPHIKDWIESSGEMEALCSLAHFAYDNPAFVYPTITEKVQLNMRGLGHPLIPAAKRVCNDIEFQQAGFVILTGSNMSGKSTFLRTIGINLLLAKTGVPVCADACETYPFDIYVCMKLSDSLHDNESYFYAELKRLKRIIDRLESGPPAFVMLDEVLRGTNSNDKLSGTLGLVETMVRLHATGLIATHDLNVCDLTPKHPDYLRNMCFEVEMTKDNLVFDYRLRQGICVNKSASFLMKRMGVIAEETK